MAGAAPGDRGVTGLSRPSAGTAPAELSADWARQLNQSARAYLIRMK